MPSRKDCFGYGVMRALVRGMALAVVVTAVAPATANAESALEMASYCKPVAEAKHLGGGRISYVGTHEAGKCMGFFDAVQQMTRVVAVGEKNRALNICTPPESTLIQMVIIFRRYVASHPAEGHKKAFFVALDALREAFPCR